MGCLRPRSDYAGKLSANDAGQEASRKSARTQPKKQGFRTADRSRCRTAESVCAPDARSLARPPSVSGSVAITWIIFGRSLGYDFFNYDDSFYVYQNHWISDGLTRAGIVRAFTHPLVGNWHPLTSLSLMLDAQMFGLNAGGYHCVNVALHTIAVLLLFFVLRAMTGALWRSAFVAAIFAIHPLRAESVVWISERKDVLSGVFFLLGLWAYCRYARKRPG